MNRLSLSIVFLMLSIASSQVNAQDVENMSIEVVDIQNMLGEWVGTLTYLDYSSNKPYSMPAELVIESKKENQKLLFNYKYPNEPKANTKGKFKISKNRLALNGKPIISRTKIIDEKIEIVTEYSGRDGNKNKKALFRNIYIIGPKTLIIRKEVQFIGSKDWIKRNEYNFRKK